jgi:hypothetical protein
LIIKGIPEVFKGLSRINFLCFMQNRGQSIGIAYFNQLAHDTDVFYDGLIHNGLFLAVSRCKFVRNM